MEKLSIDYIKYCFLFLILTAITISACNKPPVPFGQVYVNNFANIVLVDTFSANLSTVFKDSVVTSGSGTALAGNYQDPYFGNISSRSYLEIQPPADLPTLDDKSIYDSIELIAIPNKSYYGDTTATAQLAVYQLTNAIIFPLYQTQFFNNSNFAVDPTPLGTMSGLIYPNFTDSVFFRLSDALGKDLFERVNTADYSVKTVSSFIAYFRGLQLSPSPGGMHCIYGFKDSVTMRLFYHESGVFSTPEKVDFTFYNGDSKQFNQVSDDRTGTPLSGFGGADQEVVSANTNKAAYLQYITGFMPKVQFPTIRNLLLRTDYLKIIKAELVVTPIKASFNGLIPLPPQLYVYATDLTNTIGPPLPSTTGTGYQNGSLNLDPVYNANTSYVYDVTSFLQQQIAIGYTNQNGLLLVPPTPSSINSFNRAVIGDQNNSDSLQLKVYYVSSTL